MVSAFIDHESKKWKAEIICALFLPFEAEAILNIPLSFNLPEDKLIWVGNKKGDFTLKSAYYIALGLVDAVEFGECSFGDPRTHLWKKMWHLKILAKIRIFAWRASMNGLPTRLNLCKSGVKFGPLCPICDQEMESITHALFQCDLALQVWNRWEGCLVNMRGSQLDVPDIALKILNESTAQDLEIFLVTSWTIWYSRNKNVFGNVNYSVEQIWFLQT